jgi:Glycosyl transferase family 90
MEIPRINHAQFEYWKRTKVRQEDLNEVCMAVDNTWMAARINFLDPDIKVTLTKRTWERQQGHYPTVMEFFQKVAQHPSMQGKRGTILVWLEDGLWDTLVHYSQKAPIFAFGRHIRDTHTMLIPDPAYIESQGYIEDFEEIDALERDLPWEHKIPSAFWRGAASGLGFESPDWVKAPRGRLVLQAKQINDNKKIDAKLTRLKHLEVTQQEAIKALGVVDEPVAFKEFLKYRYQIDADGYCAAWKSIMLKLASQSVLLKLQSDYEQWHYWDLVPWKHYIPLKQDVSDFENIFDWLQNHDSEAKIINQQGREFVRTMDFDQALNDVANLCSEILDCYKTL